MFLSENVIQPGDRLQNVVFFSPEDDGNEPGQDIRGHFADHHVRDDVRTCPDADISATMYYHFAFMAISLALFGSGASGVFIFLIQRRLAPDRTPHLLALASQLFAVTTLSEVR